MTFRDPHDPRGPVPENPKDGDECIVSHDAGCYGTVYKSYRYVADPDPNYSHWYSVGGLTNTLQYATAALVTSRGKPQQMVRFAELVS